jgi:hypothetical protein
MKILSDMAKWREGATEFTVGVGYSENRGHACTIPKPVIEVLGDPERITFMIKGKRVEVEAAEGT